MTGRPRSTGRGHGRQITYRLSDAEWEHLLAALGSRAAIGARSRELVLARTGWRAPKLPIVHHVTSHNQRAATCGHRGGSRSKVATAVTCPRCRAMMEET